MIAPRAARLCEVGEPTAIVSDAQLVTVERWLLGGRRLLGMCLSDLAMLSSVASVPFAVMIGERAANLATRMSWQSGLPLRSSPYRDGRRLLEPFEALAQQSERANLALMAALAHMS